MEDNYISSIIEESDTLLHGTKWSEEAKERVRQARRAGRSVYDMFNSYYSKTSKQVNRGIRQLGRDGSKFVNRSVKVGQRFAKDVDRNINKAVKVGQRFVRDVDHNITKSVNDRVAKKDRATLTKKERQYIAKKYDKARKKIQYDEDTKTRRLNSPRDQFVSLITGKGSQYDREKRMKARAIRKNADKKRAKALADIKESTVNKNKYKSTGDIIDKELRKYKKKAGKAFDNITGKAKKAKRDFDMNLHKTMHPSKTISKKKFENGHRTTEVIDRGFLGKRTTTDTITFKNHLSEAEKMGRKPRKRHTNIDLTASKADKKTKKRKVKQDITVNLDHSATTVNGITII